MNVVKNSTLLLRSTKNGIEYHVYQRESLSFDVTNSFITFSISTIECFRRQSLSYPHVLSRVSISDGYDCVHIIATRGTFYTTKFLYWAESHYVIVGTAIVPSGSYMFPAFVTQTYGTFLDKIQGTLLFNRLSDDVSDSHLAYFTEVSRDAKAQLALPI
jgi:hypothetical protein